ncbi:MAG: hypothetical protein ABI378_09785, partial [Chitinophagaceae bacterium]
RWLITVFNQPLPTPPSDAQGTDGKAPKQKSDNTLGTAILNHCMTTVLSGSKQSTSYIHPSDFTTAFLDLIRNADTSQSVSPLPTVMTELIPVISNSPVLSHEQKRTLATFAQQAADEFNLQKDLVEAKQVVTDAKTEFTLFRKKVEDWYDNNTQRLIGNLKRQSQVVTFIVATLFVFSGNADTIKISKFLYANKDAREQLAQEAYKSTKNADMKSLVQAEQYKAAKNKDTAIAKILDSVALSEVVTTLQQKSVQIDSMYSLVANSVPLGWQTGEFTGLCRSGAANIFTKILGLIATILAIMLGAPFWFDLLNKVANLRGAGPKPVMENKDSEKSSG